MIKKTIQYFYRLPKNVRIVSIILSFAALFFLPNRLFYRLFEILLLLFLSAELKNLLSGALVEYILLSTMEVGKNFPKTIINIPIHFSQFFYSRQYEAAFVFLDSDLLLFFILGLLVVDFFKNKRPFKKDKICRFDLYFVLFIILIFLSTLTSINSGNSFLGFLQVVRGAMIFFLFRFYNLEKIKDKLALIFFSILTFQSVLGIGQYLKSGPVGLIFEIGQYLYPEGIRLQEAGYTFFRPTGTLTEPNLYALVLIMLLPFSILNFMFEKRRLRKFFFWASSSLGVVAVVLTFSRMGWFLLAVNLLVLYTLYKKKVEETLGQIKDSKLWKKRRFKIYLFYFLFLFLIFFSLKIFPRLSTLKLSIFEKWGSFNARIFLLKESLKIIQLYPFFGVGLFNFVPAMVKLTRIPLNEIYLSSVHNIYFLLASEVGLPAILILILFLRSLLISYLKIREKISLQDRILMDSFGISVFSFFFGGLFLSYFYAGIQLAFLTIILAIFANLTAKKQGQRKR